MRGFLARMDRNWTLTLSQRNGNACWKVEIFFELVYKERVVRHPPIWFFLFLVGILSTFSLLYAPQPPHGKSKPGWDHKPQPSWWEIEILIESKGTYSLTRKDVSYKGDYSFVLEWTGCMEQDDEDFLLFHEDWNLRSWEASEKAISPSSRVVLSTLNFQEKPRFRLNYILKREDFLFFDFAVLGFSIPQHMSGENFLLTLPASAEYADQAGTSYNVYVTRGSNRIVLQEKTLKKENVKKSFAWHWEDKEHPSGEKNVNHFFHGHDVKVTVTMLTHFE